MVRALHEATGRPAFGASANDGMDALDKAPIDVEDVVIKSHGLDQRLLKIARLSHAKLLITVRDPRDSIVSQKERFGLTLHQASMDISQSIATINSLPHDLHIIVFEYEDRFFDQKQTVADIAAFLEFSVDETTIEAIFDSLRPERVREQIASRQAALPQDEDPGCDPLTLWHSTHIGNGRTGKWRDQLDHGSQEAVGNCLNVMLAPQLWSGRPIIWPATFFTCNGNMPEKAMVSLRSSGDDDCLAYGPYLCLPRGRWRAVATLGADGVRPLDLETEIYLPWEDRVIACRRDRISHLSRPVVDLDFVHIDHFQPIEARLRATGGSVGSCKFGGWQLYWMGDALPTALPTEIGNASRLPVAPLHVQ